MKCAGLCVLVIALSSNDAVSRELRVAVEPAPGEFGSLQAAIDAAEAGDVVIVAPGEYGVRPITFRGKPITVRSESGPHATLLRMVEADSFERASVVVFDSGEGRDSVLEGFTLTGGRGTNAGDACTFSKFAGGGIVCVGDSGPTVRDCVLTENTLPFVQECGGGFGAGVAAVCYGDFSTPCTGSAFPLLIDCVITEHRNHGGFRGTGSTVFCDAGEMTLIGCTIVGNGRDDSFDGAPSGTIFCDGGSIVLESTIIADNVGRGVGVQRGAVQLRHGTITANSEGGVLCEAGATFSASSSIVWNGRAESIVPSDDTASVSVTRSCVDSAAVWPGESNLNLDPRFCGSTFGDPESDAATGARRSLSLRPTSPCIGTGAGGSTMGAVDAVCRPDFRRGDCNDDGEADISDAVFSLGSLFLGEGDPGCDDACDSNDDGAVDISDAINTLGVLFLGNGIIPLPGMMECGVDPTEDELGCDTFERCP